MTRSPKCSVKFNTNNNHLIFKSYFSQHVCIPLLKVSLKTFCSERMLMNIQCQCFELIISTNSVHLKEKHLDTTLCAHLKNIFKVYYICSWLLQDVKKPISPEFPIFIFSVLIVHWCETFDQKWSIFLFRMNSSDSVVTTLLLFC